jgi:hypothetical protein
LALNDLKWIGKYMVNGGFMSFSGYTIGDERLSHWNKLLPEWIGCFKRMCDFTHTTPSWNSKEDSNCGPFAGAAWRLGWTAFPEIKCKRTTLGGYGEVDFYFSCGNPEISEYIECKGNKINAASKASSCLTSAVNHAATIDDDTVPLKIGVAFCNVELITAQDEVMDLAGYLVTEIQSTIDYDAMAWCFPESVRTYEEEPGIFTPGVILLAKIVK